MPFQCDLKLWLSAERQRGLSPCFSKTPHCHHYNCHKSRMFVQPPCYATYTEHVQGLINKYILQGINYDTEINDGLKYE